MTRRSFRDAWLSEVMSTPVVNDACRVLLIYMALVADPQGQAMSERGRFRRKRDKIAADLGISPKRVTARIEEATRVGLLTKDPTTGHRGTVAAYQACFVGSKATPVEGPSSLGPMLRGVVKVPVNAEPFESAEREPFPGIPSGKVPAERVPQRARARARVSRTNHEQEPAPAGSREEREHDGTSQALNYGSWHPTPVAEAGEVA
jgi:hypothetical protein